MARPDPAGLESIARDVAAGRIRSPIAGAFGLRDLPAAIERNRAGHEPGKIVVDFTR